MTPIQVASTLRKIATEIDISNHPSLSSIVSRLRKIAQELSPFEQDVKNIIEKDLPAKPYAGYSPIIKSNYDLSFADVFYSYPAFEYDFHDEIVEKPDTMETQQQYDSMGYRGCFALIVFPDLDFLIAYDSDGMAVEEEIHEYDSAGRLVKTNVSSSDVGADAFSAVKSASGIGSLITNADFTQKAREHGYKFSF